MPDDLDTTQGKLVYLSGDKMGAELPFVKDRAVISDTISIEHTQGIYLLRALTSDGVTVSGKKVHEKILEVGDQILIGNTELEFGSGATDKPVVVAAKGSSNEKLRLVLVAIIALVAGGWIVSTYLSKKHGKEETAEIAKSSQKPIAPSAPSRQLSEQDRDEKIRLARIQFEIAERFFADGNVSDQNLYNAVKIYENIISDLEGIQPEILVAQKAKDRLMSAQLQLDTQMKYLKNNAYVAKEIGDNQAMRAILKQMMDTMPDPSNEHFQWAQTKFLTMPAQSK
jgi:hypothetical protein